MYTLKLMTQAQKDAKKLSAHGLKEKTLTLLNIIKENPWQYPPEYELLRGYEKVNEPTY